MTPGADMYSYRTRTPDPDMYANYNSVPRQKSRAPAEPWQHHSKSSRGRDTYYDPHTDAPSTGRNPVARRNSAASGSICEPHLNLKIWLRIAHSHLITLHLPSFRPA